jgi:hypothetical protein
VRDYMWKMGLGKWPTEVEACGYRHVGGKWMQITYCNRSRFFSVCGQKRRGDSPMKPLLVDRVS